MGLHEGEELESFHFKPSVATWLKPLVSSSLNTAGGAKGTCVTLSVDECALFQRPSVATWISLRFKEFNFVSEAASASAEVVKQVEDTPFVRELKSTAAELHSLVKAEGDQNPSPKKTVPTAPPQLAPSTGVPSSQQEATAPISTAAAQATVAPAATASHKKSPEKAPAKRPEKQEGSGVSATTQPSSTPGVASAPSKATSAAPAAAPQRAQIDAKAKSAAAASPPAASTPQPAAITPPAAAKSASTRTAQGGAPSGAASSSATFASASSAGQQPATGTTTQGIKGIDSMVDRCLDRFFSNEEVWRQVGQEVTLRQRASAGFGAASTGLMKFKIQVPKPYPGVQYRKSKNLDDRYQRFAENGGIVEGIVEDGGQWLQVSDNVYLPMRVGAVQLLEALGEDQPQRSAVTGTQPHRWWMCCSGEQVVAAPETEVQVGAGSSSGRAGNAAGADAAAGSRNRRQPSQA